jgi:hypothetical protein
VGAEVDAAGADAGDNSSHGDDEGGAGRARAELPRGDQRDRPEERHRRHRVGAWERETVGVRQPIDDVGSRPVERSLQQGVDRLCAGNRGDGESCVCEPAARHEQSPDAPHHQQKDAGTPERREHLGANRECRRRVLMDGGDDNRVEVRDGASGDDTRGQQREDEQGWRHAAGSSDAPMRGA